MDIDIDIEVEASYWPSFLEMRISGIHSPEWGKVDIQRMLF